MSRRYLAVLAAATAIAVGADFAMVNTLDDIVWGATVRGYWVLFGFGWVIIGALVIPALGRLIRRPADYYSNDEHGDE